LVMKNKKEYTSAVCTMALLSAVPAPCPASVSILIKTGFSPCCAAC